LFPSPFSLMKKKAWPTVLFTILLLFLFLPTQNGFEIVAPRKQQVLRFIPSASDLITIGWRHSVERQPWQEIYRSVDDGQLVLLETRFKAYGAGVPDVDGHVDRIEDGFLVIRGIERKINHYSLFYTPGSQYYVETNGIKYPLKDFVPPDTAITISQQRISFFDRLKIKWGEEAAFAERNK